MTAPPVLEPDNDHDWDPRSGGSNRFATVFLYLSDVAEGGQTVFPLAETRRTPRQARHRG